MVAVTNAVAWLYDFL